MKKKTAMTVLSREMLTPEICSLVLQYAKGEEPGEVRPGQFAGLYTGEASMLLPRPISICRWEPSERALRFVFRIAGRGTAVLAQRRPGDTVEMLGILGNGYPMDALCGKKCLLLGGGIGIPPMLELAAALHARCPETVTAVLGYRDHALFLKEEFESFARVLVATEDGSCGTKGNVLDAVREQGVEAEAVCTCGPLPMLRAVKQYAQEKGIPAWISLEERMACGIGVCLGCVTPTVQEDAHSRVKNARICTEGPVFDAREVELR